MIASALELYSYVKAPKLTFAARHPRRALKVAKTRWDMKHAYAPRIAAAGAALVALPAGYVVGRARREGGTLGRGVAAALMAAPIGYLIGRVSAAERRAAARAARWRENGDVRRGRGRELSEPRQQVSRVGRPSSVEDAVAPAGQGATTKE